MGKMIGRAMSGFVGPDTRDQVPHLGRPTGSWGAGATSARPSRGWITAAGRARCEFVESAAGPRSRSSPFLT